MFKHMISKKTGITLIALVVTIIVLLILAGISIQMLTGDNGILQKATDTKEITERKSVIESAQIDILGQIAENKGETITETQLKIILGKYFEEFDDELPEDLSKTAITLTAKEEYGGYEDIALIDIYNGKISVTSNITKITFSVTNSRGGILATYEAEEGMTFRQWIEKYSPEGVYIEESYVCAPMPLCIGYSYITPDTVIEDEASYNWPPD